MSEKAWSIDEEGFNYSDLGDLIDNNRDELTVGQKVWFGDAVPPKYKHLCDADDIIEMMGERAYDYVSEHADNFPNVSKEAIDELDLLLLGWQEKHCPITFYIVENIKEYIITDEDLA